MGPQASCGSSLCDAECVTASHKTDNKPYAENKILPMGKPATLSMMWALPSCDDHLCLPYEASAVSQSQ